MAGDHLDTDPTGFARTVQGWLRCPRCREGWETIFRLDRETGTYQADVPTCIVCDVDGMEPDTDTIPHEGETL